MFSLVKPSQQAIREFLGRQQSHDFSYPHVGESRTTAPAGYVHDHNRIRLGTGRVVFEKAAAALSNWRMFPARWTEVHASATPIAVDNNVAVLARRFGVWSLNACRIVYRIDEDGLIARFGFAYGTLSEHLESGEERFTVEWHRIDDSVWYDIFAFSKPNGWLPRLLYPLVRNAQKQFARDSLAAILHAVNAASEECRHAD